MSRFNKISLEEAKKIAKEKNLKPGRVKGTDAIQFTKGKAERIEVISWDEFEKLLKKRGLGIYEYQGWMKLMNA